MIATIVFGTLIILSIFGSVCLIIDDELVIATFFGCLSLLMGVFLYLNLSDGYYFKGDPVEKARIEYEIENTNPNWDALKEAQEYNEAVNKSNDYWHRFVIEDRSQWLIDVDKYLEDKNE